MRSDAAVVSQPDPPCVVWPDFWAMDRCRAVRAAMETGDAVPAEVIGGGYTVDEVARRALDVEPDDDTVAWVEREIERLRVAAEERFGIELRETEGPAFVRYRAGAYYRRHVDRGEGAERRRVSVVLFLNDMDQTAAGADSFTGGALRLHDPAGSGLIFDIVPCTGLAIAFRADTPHEVLPVTAGIRDVVVCWFA